MFKSILLVLLAAIAMTGITARESAAGSAGQLKKTIQGIYDQANLAADSKNIEGALARYDTATAATVRPRLSRLLAMSQTLQFKSEVVSVQPEPGNKFAAIVIVQNHFQGFVKMGKGATGVMISDTKVREYWIKEGANWVTLKMRVLASRRTLNNKPMNG